MTGLLRVRDAKAKDLSWSALMTFAVVLGSTFMVMVTPPVPTAKGKENANKPMTPSIITQSQIDAYAAAYCRLTGFALSHRGVFDHRTRAWYEFIRAGHSLDDLELVIRWIQRGIRLGTRRTGALRFSTLIERPDLFGEEVQLAKAEKRNVKPSPSPREKMVATFRARDPEPEPTDAKHVSELIANLKRAAGMPIKP